MLPQPPGAPVEPDRGTAVRSGVERIGRAMSVGVGPWIRLDLQARLVAEHDEVLLHVVRADGRISRSPANDDVRAGVRELRRLMYDRSAGAWLSARITADPPLQLQLNLNYNDDPLWEQPPPIAAYHRDLRAFPRPPELLTGWLQTRLEQSA